MNRYHAHRPNRLREAIEIVAFFALFAAIVIALTAVES